MTVSITVCSLVQSLTLLVTEENGVLTSQLLICCIDELLSHINRILSCHGCGFEEVALCCSQITRNNLFISDGLEAIIQICGSLTSVIALRGEDAVAESFAKKLEQVHRYQLGDRSVLKRITLYNSRTIDALYYRDRIELLDSGTQEGLELATNNLHLLIVDAGVREWSNLE